MRREVSLVVCLAVALGSRARATDDEAKGAKQAVERPSGAAAQAASTSTPQVLWAAPEVPPIDRSARPAPSRTAAPSAGPAAPSARAATPSARGKAATPELVATMQAVSVKDGEAHVRLPEGERTLRAGDRLGADRVRSVADGLIVLDRPAAPGKAGGAATVIVRFDAAGQPRVRVLYESNPTPAQVPEVR